MNFTFRPVIPLLVIFLAGKAFFLLLAVLVICVSALLVNPRKQYEDESRWHSVHIYMDFIECIPEGWIARHGTRELSARIENDIKLSLEQEGNNGKILRAF